MQMIYLIFLGLTFFIQLLAASWYDLASKTKSAKEVFKYKLLCSSVYIADFLLCSAISEPYKDCFFYPMATGFLLFFCADISESKSKKNADFTSSIIKSTATLFLAISFIIKFYDKFFNIVSDYKYFLIAAVAVVITVSFVVLFLKTKLNIKFRVISAVLLATTGVIFSVFLQNTGEAKMQATSCAVTMGVFALSIHSVIETIPKIREKTLLSTNAYYFGLMFLACSII